MLVKHCNFMGSRNLKTIKGKKYLYYIISENGKKRAIYCGLASKIESEKKTLELELQYLKLQKKDLTQKVVMVERQLKKMK